MQHTYQQLIKHLDALLDNEYDFIANAANASALLFQTLPNINWAGFYLLKNNELILGPFQGKVACMHIPLNKGVCGHCATTKTCVRVDDVHLFPGHIACDSASASEIVIPLVKNDELIAVLDIDSPIKARFSEIDEFYLKQYVDCFLSHLL